MAETLDPRLTKRQLFILRMMHDLEEELVYERGHGYVGLTRVGKSTVMALIRAMAIRADPHSTVGKFERYTINETGRSILNAE